MANDYVKPYINIADFTFGLCEKFLVLCPENIWLEKFGGFPVCDQYYHALIAAASMVSSISGKPIDNPVPDAGNLSIESEKQPTTEEAKNYLLNIIKAFKNTTASLSNEDLPKKNIPMSEKLGRDISVAETLGFISCHTQYHLGACDGALRATGLAAAF